MKGCISYSLFGYGQNVANSFEFNTYLRGLMVNVRINRVLYPGWDTVVNIDGQTLNSPFKRLFDWLGNMPFVHFNIFPSEGALCWKMLWRLSPMFWKDGDEPLYGYVLCRDLDSIGTYRERQAVLQWVQEDKTIHCITDSVSHNIPMMGGMIGIRPQHFTMRMRINSWDELMQLAGSMDFSRKGSDQDFLNSKIYPKCADSATEHFILGMKQTIPEGGGRHYSIPDVEVDGVPTEHKMLNDCAGHIGAAGYYEPPMVKWLNQVDPYRDEYAEIERQFPNIFFWRT